MLTAFGCCSKNCGHDKFQSLTMKFSKYIAAFCMLGVDGVLAVPPTSGDLAVLLAKGYFSGYVSQDASLEQCAAFLNSKGVCFSLFDLMDTEKAVTKEDFARAIGQTMMLFSGEAEVVSRCIKKPLEMETWVDCCLLNDIDLQPIWDKFVQRTAEGSLPEVKRFFGEK